MEEKRSSLDQSSPLVETFHWNPRRPKFRGRIGKRLPIRAPLNNFGDLLGPLIVQEILRREGLVENPNAAPKRLLSIGSILHFAKDGDIVWGSGVNGKMAAAGLDALHLDVRSVRGPLTRGYLLEHGVDAPEMYGDPGLLTSVLWPEYRTPGGRPARPTIVMNFNDQQESSKRFKVVNPRQSVERCLRDIASSSLVIGSSLHAIIVAESYGVPARLIRSAHEPAFKYDDYYAGTGRPSYITAENVQEAVELGGEKPPLWSAPELLQTFPRDLWIPGNK